VNYSKQTILLLILTIVLLSTFRTLGQDVEIRPVFHLENVIDLVASPSGHRFAVAQENGELSIWSSDEYELLLILQTETPIYTSRLLWSPDGHQLAATFTEGVYVWDSETGDLLHTLSGHPVEIVDEGFRDNMSGISDVVFSPDGSVLATAHTYDKAVILWDTETGDITRLLGGHPEGVQRLDFSPDGSVIAATSRFSESTILSDVDTGQIVRELNGAATTVAFSPDGTLLAAGLGDETSSILVWHLETGDKLQSFEAPLSISNLDWTTNSRFIIGEFDSRILTSEGQPYAGAGIRVWDVESGATRYMTGDNGDEIFSYALSPDDTLLAAGTELGNIIVWNFNTEDRLHSWRADSDPIPKIFWLITNDVLVSISRGKTATFWQIVDA
jgi:WD40 repeat protein